MEAGGVDNWEGYGEALRGYWEENELEEKREDFLEKIAEILSESTYEPSEIGAGFTFDADSIDEAMKFIVKSGVYFKEEK